MVGGISAQLGLTGKAPNENLTFALHFYEIVIDNSNWAYYKFYEMIIHNFL